MKNLFLAAMLTLGVARGAAAVENPFYSNSFDGSSTTLKMMGRFAVRRSTTPSVADTLNIDGPRGLFTWLFGINASTAVLTGTGAAVYSLTTSSGISVAAGGVTAPWFSGVHYGTSTSLGGGAIGRIPVQSAVDVSTFLPAMGNGGLIIGAGTSAIPSTGTLTGNAAVTITNSAGGIAISLNSSSATLKNSSGFVNNFEIDGSSIVKLTSGGLVPNALIDATSVTKQGNLFNGVNQLVKTDGSGFLPALNGSNLTNISGTLSGGTNGFNARWTSATSMVAGPFSTTASSETVGSGATLFIDTAGAFTTSTGSVVTGMFNVADSSSVTGGSAASNFNIQIASANIVFIGGYTQQTADAVYYLRFGNGASIDSGANYSYTGVGEQRATALSQFSDADSKCQLQHSTAGNAAKVGAHTQIHIALSVVRGGGGRRVTAVITTSTIDFTGGNWTVFTTACGYTGASPVTTMQISATAGTFIADQRELMLR